MLNNSLIIDRLDDGQFVFFAVGNMARKLRADLASLGDINEQSFAQLIWQVGCDEIAHESAPDAVVKVMSRLYFNSLIKCFVEARL